MELNLLFTQTLIAKTHPHHFDGRPLNQDAHIKVNIQHIVKPLTGVASCPCDAAGIQRRIVMPGCPSAPILFKALPSG